MILRGRFVATFSEIDGEIGMKLLHSRWASVCWYFALVIPVFLVGLGVQRFMHPEPSEDLIADHAPLFRNNAFVGFDDKELEARFGLPLQCDIMEDVKDDDFFWWPSIIRDGTPMSIVKPGQTVRILIYADPSDREVLIYVCQLLDSNGVWRVISDVTPPKNIVF